MNLEQFWSLLSQERSIVDALQHELGSGRDRALTALRQGESLAAWGGLIEEVISDVMQSEAVEVCSMPARGGNGTFLVSVMRFGPVFWYEFLEAGEFGYFRSSGDAVARARFDCEVFFEAYEDWLMAGGGDGG